MRPREGETQADVSGWGRLQMSHCHLLGQKRLQSGITIFHLVCPLLYKHLLNAYYMPGTMHPRKTLSLVLSTHKCRPTVHSRRATQTSMCSLHPEWNSKESPGEILGCILGLRILIFRAGQVAH